MSLLAFRAQTKKDTSNIITLGVIAGEEKKKDPSVVNATIGTLYDETGKLFTFKSVDEALNELTPAEKYAYASTPGSKAYHEALKRWIFREHYDEFMKNNHVSVMATPGGTGALANTFSNYLNSGEKVLLPSFMWANYKQLAYEAHANYDTYNMFKDGHLDLEDIEEKMNELKEFQNRVVIVINDPCHNPTGYIMTRDEWIELIAIINRVAADGTPVVLLHDMAYIDYDTRGFEFTRGNIALYQNLDPNVLVIMAFSGSKTMALYGLRVGAMVAVSKNEKNIKDFDQASKFTSRATWSNTTNLGMNIVSKIILDDAKRKVFEEELEIARQMLIKRANAFIEACNDCKLETIPFKCGFFISIPCDNPQAVYDALVAQKIHIIPMKKMVRVTIAAINLADCKRLPAIIKKAIEENK